jgi:NADPH:quinone reductase-like Zn-dependent oxidoreductase
MVAKIPGHEIVGRVDMIGADVEGPHMGERVGIPWLGDTCPYCMGVRKSVRSSTQRATAASRRLRSVMSLAFPVGEAGSDVAHAPLLCAQYALCAIGLAALGPPSCHALQCWQWCHPARRLSRIARRCWELVRAFIGTWLLPQVGNHLGAGIVACDRHCDHRGYSTAVTNKSRSWLRPLW